MGGSRWSKVCLGTVRMQLRMFCRGTIYNIYNLNYLQYISFLIRCLFFIECVPRRWLRGSKVCLGTVRMHLRMFCRGTIYNIYNLNDLKYVPF